MRKFIRLTMFPLTICFLLLLIACEENSGNGDEPLVASHEVKIDSPLAHNKIEKLPSTAYKEDPKSISITAVGDILIHEKVYEDAYSQGGYDFMPMFREVEQYLDDTTITIANQETMIGGTDIGLSGYPAFNSPYEIGDTLKEVGVDVVSIANNHSLDRGEEAVQNAISHWEQIDMMYTGAYKNKKDSDRIRVLETDEGIDVAFLSYTYGTNGIPVPEGKDYLVNLIERKALVEDIKKAKQAGDVLILSLHFGTEYEQMPNQEQIDLVQLAADQEVDAVIGHHPHVLQPVDWVEGKNGNETFAAYSLGNFLSGQDEFYNQIGGILKFDIQESGQKEEREFEVVNPRFLPTYVTFSQWADYRVVPMHQVNEREMPSPELHYNRVKEHMSRWVPELEFIE
ncbi:CapA family protein [Sediminibacillus massiliensis]|uniref:CapA family protein n=1 Tax=Sediminibacillus massiliensis TaxID=1926277 RepID=UPI00098894AD|nr:CapA family protein [Sediminibacillus massiliensis]